LKKEVKSCLYLPAGIGLLHILKINENQYSLAVSCSFGPVTKQGAGKTKEMARKMLLGYKTSSAGRAGDGVPGGDGAGLEAAGSVPAGVRRE
jgi:hypothetical protein